MTATAQHKAAELRLIMHCHDGQYEPGSDRRLPEAWVYFLSYDWLLSPVALACDAILQRGTSASYFKHLSLQCQNPAKWTVWCIVLLQTTEEVLQGYRCWKGSCPPWATPCDR